MPVLSVGSVYVAERPAIVRRRVSRGTLKVSEIARGRLGVMVTDNSHMPFSTFSHAQKETSWPAIDLTVALTTFPSLVVLTLLLDFNLTADWSERRDSTAVVLALVAAFLAVSLFTIGYVSYRLGFRLWAGPLDGDGLTDADRVAAAAAAAAHRCAVNAQPPSYEWVIQVIADEEDADLPKYESVRELGCVLHI